MPGMTEICVFLAWIAGGFVSGVSGIGGAMVAFPFLVMLLPVHEVIALTCIVNMVMDLCLAGLHFRFCRVSALWPMLLASVPGSFAGLYILQVCSGPVLQGAVGLLLLYYVYWQKTFRARGSIAHPRALGAVAGFGSGDNPVNLCGGVLVCNAQGFKHGFIAHKGVVVFTPPKTVFRPCYAAAIPEVRKLWQLSRCCKGLVAAWVLGQE